MEPERFRNRNEAGRLLANKLTAYANRPDVLVLALPRGGVLVAYEVARALGAPLDVFVVRKLGVPGHEELAMGAIATGGVRVLNDQIVQRLRIPEYIVDAVAAREQPELRRRERLYRGGRPPPQVRGRTVILVDDGLATGATMRAAIMALRQLQPARIVVAIPTGSPETCEELKAEVDEVVCAITPDPFLAVGHWYEDFSQTTDEEVRDLLARRQQPEAAQTSKGTTDEGLLDAVRKAAHPLTGDAGDYDPLMARRDDRIAEEELFYAEQNARLVKNAEEYYRSMFFEDVSSWNLRDSRMVETLDARTSVVRAGTRRLWSGHIIRIWAMRA
jgi:predicted phosphoribosyltransferase